MVAMIFWLSILYRKRQDEFHHHLVMDVIQNQWEIKCQEEL